MASSPSVAPKQTSSSAAQQLLAAIHASGPQWLRAALPTPGGVQTAGDGAEASLAASNKPKASSSYSAEELGRLLTDIVERLSSVTEVPVATASTSASNRGALAVAASAVASSFSAMLSAWEVQNLVESIRQATEMLVWGEGHDGSFFDLFCEQHLLAGFVRALRAPSTPQPVRVQLLQSISILVQSARRETSFFYLLSGGHLSSLLTDSDALDLDDEEVLAYFGALLKGLALRLDAETAPLFLSKSTLHYPEVCSNQHDTPVRARRFPLFEQAVRFVTHSDSMARTSARTALLALLRLGHPQEVRASTVWATQDQLVPRLATAIRDAWETMVQGVVINDEEMIRTALESEEDLLGFVNDIFILDINVVTNSLAQGILATALLPLFIGLAPPEEDLPHASPKSSFEQLRDKTEHEELHEATLKAAPHPPIAAVALHAAAFSSRTLGAHRCLVEPLAKVLLWPSVPCSVVSAIQSPGVDGSISVDLIFSSDIVGTEESCNGFQAVSSSNTNLVPNPFRASMLAMLGDGEDFAPSEAALVAWFLRELQAVLPSALLEDIGLLPRTLREQAGPSYVAEHFVKSLRVRSGLPRIAQRIIASSLVELVSPPRAEGLRTQVAESAVAALKEAGELLLAEMEANHACTNGGRTRVDTSITVDGGHAVACFLDELEWHMLRTSPIDLSSTCGGAQCLLQSARNRRLRLARQSVAKQASRSLLSLRRLLADLAALGAPNREDIVSELDLDKKGRTICGTIGRMRTETALARLVVAGGCADSYSYPLASIDGKSKTCSGPHLDEDKMSLERVACVELLAGLRPPTISLGPDHLEELAAASEVSWMLLLHSSKLILANVCQEHHARAAPSTPSETQDCERLCQPLCVRLQVPMWRTTVSIVTEEYFPNAYDLVAPASGARDPGVLNQDQSSLEASAVGHACHNSSVADSELTMLTPSPLVLHIPPHISQEKRTVAPDNTDDVARLEKTQLPEAPREQLQIIRLAVPVTPVAGGKLTLSSVGSPSGRAEEVLYLRFADTESCAQALSHIECCRNREVRKLMTQLVQFVNGSLQEALAELPGGAGAQSSLPLAHALQSGTRRC